MQPDTGSMLLTGREPKEDRAWIALITGGARSGKSSYAQQEALRLSSCPVYVATARRDPADEAFSSRIRRHMDDRDPRWTSIEEPLYVSRLDLDGKVVVIDCVTLWLSNFFSLTRQDEEKSLQMIREEMENLRKFRTRFLIVTNEIGMGVHAETEIGRRFTDLQGWANQYIAGLADEVVFMVSGIAMNIKSSLGQAFLQEK